ncbi:response regulator [Pontibacter sp. E15-1]|uniref:hybrid sensor histidine kinase/response regulator transcription factor n=1 Tax=Pontibacter sp. E15-1 TaxID=2919918 RepID=UPI001F502B32|nr:two-component regulator propeller domain-containing protein [Pontibacter sp. E15-1]MCJ8164297.1 response regulator [Pontibacter sp. E15-1]
MLLTVCAVYSGSRVGHWDDYKISYLGIEKGLSNNAVTSIYQDTRGFMWIGTYDGLNRYNGYDFQVFRNQPSDSSTLINNRIVSIYGDEKQIWVGTKKGVSVYNYLTGKFESRYCNNPELGKIELIDVAINKIKGYKGRTYIATGGRGLMYQEGDNSICRKIPLNVRGELIWNFHAQDVVFDTMGRMWVFIQGQGIAMAEPGEQELHTVFSGIKSGSCMVFDGAANLWVGLDNGILRYNIRDNTDYVYSQQVIRHKIADLLYLKDKNELWIATDGNGMVQYDMQAESFTPLNEGAGNSNLTSNAVYALYQDNGGRKWVGTLRGGVNILEDDNLAFRTISRNRALANTLPSNFVLSFCEQDPDNILIGTDGKGLSLWNRSRNTFTNYAHDSQDPLSLPDNFVTTLIKGKKGFWVGTYRGGVSLFDEKTGRFKKYSLFNEKFKSEQESIWVLFKDAKEQLWAATSDGEGLYKYNPQEDKFNFVYAGISGILTLAQDQAGNLWAGTFGQLIKLDLNKMNHEVFDIGYPVRAITAVSANRMLLGTEGGGLYKFNPKTGQRDVLTEADGLPNNSVLNILRDNAGMYWLSTYNGVSKFDLKSGKMVNYFDEDGLQSNQFSYNAALKLSSGELLMGGIIGFTVINPTVAIPARQFPELRITGVNVNNVPLEDEGKTAFAIDKLELPYDKSMLSIEFVALEYSMPDKISYAYFLDGWDREWQDIGNARVANYSKLADGDYVLNIKSTNADGTWNPQIISLPITIHAPWYRTWPAYLLYFLLGSGLFAALVMYQRKQARLKYEIRLSKDLARQEKELHEKKLTFFTNISHEFRSPLTMIINPLKEMLYGQKQEFNPGGLEVVYRNSRRLLSLVDQLLLFRKTESETGELKVVRVEAVNMLKEVYACFVHHAKSKNIDYVFQTNAEEVLIYADKQKIELAVFNLISNALKFTPQNEGKVVLKLSSTPLELAITVSDNGVGIADAEKGKVFNMFFQSAKNTSSNSKGFGIGLYLVRQLVQQHFGEVTCADNDLGGTTFTINLKKGKAHFKDELIREDVEEHALYLDELVGEKELVEEQPVEKVPVQEVMEEIVQKDKTICVIDDNPQIRQYVSSILSDTYRVTEAKSAEEGIALIRQRQPDLIISDVVMGEMNGIELCKLIKNDRDLRHIPVILLTASGSEEIKLTGIEVGADDYITKPFDKDYLKARIKGILKRQETVQNHLLNVVTQNPANQKLSDLEKEFLNNLVKITELNMEDGCNMKSLAEKVGMSHSAMYKKIKQITGKSVNEFVRAVRLRKVANLLITSGVQVGEAATMCGFKDLKYFRTQFQQQYEMNPSEFQKKYKHALQDKQYVLNKSFWKTSES